MTDLNDVKLIGRITKDSILERTADVVYAKFSIAVNKDVKSENGDYISTPTFIDLAIFDNYAEKMYKFLRKGTQVLIQGSLKQRQWIKDDLKINTLGVSVNKVQLLSSSKASGSSVENDNNESVEETSADNTSVPVEEQLPFDMENEDPFDDKTQGIF